MHSNAGEKMAGWDQGLLAQNWASPSPARQSGEFNLLPRPSFLRASGTRGPGQHPAWGRVTLDVYSWGGVEGILRAVIVVTFKTVYPQADQVPRQY